MPGRAPAACSDFLLGGSYSFGTLALVLQASAHVIFDRAEMRQRMQWDMESRLETIRTSGVAYMLTSYGLGHFEVYLLGGAALAVLGTTLGLLAFALQWKRPIPAALAVLLNITPSLISLAFVLQGKAT